jgi:CheY-like chemotaxis protein
MDPHVLVVDDDPDICFALSAILEDEGYRVVCAENGRAALEHLAGGARPAIILLDLMMPTMDGWAFLRERRQDPYLSVIPVAVFSAAERNGFPSGLPDDHYLRKPVELDRVMDIVGRYCGAPELRC